MILRRPRTDYREKCAALTTQPTDPWRSADCTLHNHSCICNGTVNLTNNTTHDLKPNHRLAF